MGKILCPGCGKKVRESAESCPHCGYPVKMLDGFGARRMMCRYCGEGNRMGAEVCRVCGKPLNNPAASYRMSEPNLNGAGGGENAWTETSRTEAAGGESARPETAWTEIPSDKAGRQDDMTGRQSGESQRTEGRISGANMGRETGREYPPRENRPARKAGMRGRFSGSNIFTSTNLYLVLIGGIIIISVVSGMIEKANERKSREALNAPLWEDEETEESAVDVLDEESTSYVPNGQSPDNVMDENYIDDMLEDYSVTVNYETAAVLDENGIYVAMVGQEQAFKDGEIHFKLEIRNDTAQDVVVIGDNMAINGIMVTPQLYEVVKAGSEVQAEFGVEEELWALNITEVADVMIGVSVLNNESDELLAQTGAVGIPVSAGEGYVQVYEEDGEILYDQHGVKIMLAGEVEISSFVLSLPLYIENNTGRDLSVWEDEVKVNGISTDGFIGCRIYPGCKSYTDLRIYADTLEESGIDNPEYMQMSLLLWDTETVEDVFKTDAVRIDF